jgi:prepilin-type N-terminal cleavage/methylation domain-containing protein/prepilin-type processing-associated H-X9-DG protein
MRAIRPTSVIPEMGDAAERRGFTLLELLITIAVISLLLTLALPTMARALGSARAFKCQMGQRSIVFDFSVYADDILHGNRGDDADEVGTRFQLDNFVERQYGIAEFWRFPDPTQGRAPDEAGVDPMRCPEVKGELVFTNGFNCNDSRAISPQASISYTFNMRLHRVERVKWGMYRLEKIFLRPNVLEASQVPLCWDVDGAAAQAKGAIATFSAPSLDSDGPMAGDAFWYPGLRHNGEGNFAFIDGHVEASAQPLRETYWNWAYQGAR